MDNAEICVLAALCPEKRLLRNPWRHKGFSWMAKAFLEGHHVIMGQKAWDDFPYKDETEIIPWVVSNNPCFQLSTRQRYTHVRFTEDLQVLHRFVPLKGIWWVLGGFSIFEQVVDLADSVEAVVVTGDQGAVDLFGASYMEQTHTCPNPFDRKLDCVRYERTQVPAISMQQMPLFRVR